MLCVAALSLGVAAAAQAKVVIPIHDSIGGAKTTSGTKLYGVHYSVRAATNVLSTLQLAVSRSCQGHGYLRQTMHNNLSGFGGFTAAVVGADLPKNSSEASSSGYTMEVTPSVPVCGKLPHTDDLTVCSLLFICSSYMLWSGNKPLIMAQGTKKRGINATKKKAVMAAAREAAMASLKK